jgi:hypothetical protein
MPTHVSFVDRLPPVTCSFVLRGRRLLRYAPLRLGSPRVADARSRAPSLRHCPLSPIYRLPLDQVRVSLFASRFWPLCCRTAHKSPTRHPLSLTPGSPVARRWTHGRSRFFPSAFMASLCVSLLRDCPRICYATPAESYPRLSRGALVDAWAVTIFFSPPLWLMPAFFFGRG